MIARECLRIGLIVLAAAIASCSRVENPVTHATRSVELRVGGMTCAACEKTICSSLGSVEGVQSCTADHVAGSVTIVYAPAQTDAKKLADAIRTAGYEVP